MQEFTVDRFIVPVPACEDILAGLLKEGARKMPAQAIEAEVEDWIEGHKHHHDEQGRRQVVRNGRMPKRTILTGVGQVEVEQPRVHDRRPAAEAEKFTSKILPPYLRKAKSNRSQGTVPIFAAQKI
jgi:putative transposase